MREETFRSICFVALSACSAENDAPASVVGSDAGHEEPGEADAFDDGISAADASNGGDAEMGRLEGMTAAHNAVRAMVATTPAIPPLMWSSTLAAYAQEWATTLASNPATCAQPPAPPGVGTSGERLR